MNEAPNANASTSVLIGDSSDKEGLMRARLEKIAQDSKKKIKAIEMAAATYRRTLLEQREQSLEIEEADINVCRLQMERDVQTVKEAIYGAEHVVLGPIQMLPTEILCDIFRHHVESDLSPWILTKVSKFWMQTALNTPRLCCHVMVRSRTNYRQSTTHVVNGRKQASVGRWQIISDVAEFQAALYRSGALTIAISVDYDSSAPVGIFPSILRQILSNPLSRRIRHLDIGKVYLGDEDLDATMAVGEFTALNFIQFPEPVTVWGIKLENAIDATSQRLETVGLHDVSRASLSAYSFWGQIKHISLGLSHGPLKRQGLNLLIQQLVSVERIDNIPDEWPNADTPPSSLPCLQELTVRCEPRHLCKLDLPSLETLKFGATRSAYPEEGHDKLSYPMLVTLELSSMDSDWPKYTAGAFVATENLTVNCEADDETIVAILEHMPNVRNVKLQASTKQNFTLILVRRLRSAEEPVLCPNLESLRIGGGVGHSAVCTERSSAEASLKNLVKFREHIGKPLRELVVRWIWRFSANAIDYAAPSG